jgi:hypothetical protein
MSGKSTKIYALLRNISLFCLLCSVTEISAQSFDTDSLPSIFRKFGRENLQEKIYAHTDKDLFITSEIVWFKIYTVDAASNKPLALSKIAYAEIIDKDQKPVLQAKIALEQGSGSGSLQLPASLPSGIYQFRVYTNWMKNYGPDYFFEKSLTLINALNKPEILPAVNVAAYDIQFFPEGGNMVEGIKSKVAFRATNSSGQGINFEAALVDEDADTVARFRPLKFGIGHFYFTPMLGKTYKALIKIPGEAAIIKQIPQVHKTGYVMALNESPGDKLRLTVQSNETSSAQTPIFLLVHTRHQPKITGKLTLSQGISEFVIDKAKLGEGISHFTIFNASGRPVCERLYFTKPASALVIKAKPDQQQYAARQKVTLNLEFKDETGQLSDADASVSVYAASAGSNPADIASYLWLKSDLKGNVEDPGYYLKNTDAQTVEAADNLMLTHGWRRFVWEDVLSGKPARPQFLPELEGQIMSGRITDLRTNSPAANIIAYLSVPGKKLHLYAATSGPSGDVRFFTKDIAGPVELIAQTNFETDSTYRVDMLSPFFDKYRQSSRPFPGLSQELKNHVLTQSVGVQVQNAYVGNKLNTFYRPAADSVSFYSKPDKTYLLDNFVRFNTMEEVLREYVTEVSVTRQRENFLLWVAYRAHQDEFIRNVKPLLVLDGVPIFDTGTRMIKYDPKKIRSIEVVNRKYIHGPLKLPAIVHFKSYKSSLPDFPLDTRTTIMDYEGTQLKREFYSPVYETRDQASDRLPDFRNLLYWSPDIGVDKTGNKTISFYTSDQRSAYTVVVEGITSSGKPGSAAVNIEVK